jgi:hypothetical protein
VQRFIPLILVFLVSVCATFAQTTISFQRDVAPVLQRRCVNCHNEENPKGGYRLDTFAALQTAGDSGEKPLLAGKAGESEIHRLLVTKDADERMPQKADALPEEEIKLIERWMNEGAAFDGNDPQRPLAELVRDIHLRPAPAHYARPMPITAMTFNGDGRRLAVSGYREMLIWNSAEGTLARRVSGLPERITGLAWNPKKNLIAVAGGTPGQWGTVALVDAANGYRTRFLCDLPELVLSVAFTPEGDTVVAGCGDRTLRLFDTSSGKSKRVLRLHADWVQSVAFNSSGTRLVTASRDRTARVLDTKDWHQVSSYQGHYTGLLAATFSFDGLRVYTTARGSEAHAWNPEAANRQGSLDDLGGDVRQIASSPYGIITSGADGETRIYQIGSKKPWMTLPGHRDGVNALAVTADGEQIATGSADGEVIIWSPACWAPTVRFTAAP